MSEVGRALIIAAACVAGSMCATAALKATEKWLWRVAFALMALLNFFNATNLMMTLIAQ